MGTLRDSKFGHFIPNDQKYFRFSVHTIIFQIIENGLFAIKKESEN